MCLDDYVVDLEGGVDCVAECVPLGDCKDWFSFTVVIVIVIVVIAIVE